MLDVGSIPTVSMVSVGNRVSGFPGPCPFSVVIVAEWFRRQSVELITRLRSPPVALSRNAEPAVP